MAINMGKKQQCIENKDVAIKRLKILKKEKCGNAKDPKACGKVYDLAIQNIETSKRECDY